LVRVLEVNNFRDGVGRKWVHLLKASLSANGVRPDVIGWEGCSEAKFGRYDGVVLSGSEAMVSDERTVKLFSRELDALRDSSTPVLGICFGHQLLCRAFGSKVVRSAKPIERFVETEVVAPDPIFEGIPRKMGVFEAHYEVVDSVPSGFKLLARSPTSTVGAVRHRKRPLYGVQFHPERNSSLHPDGSAVMANFVRSIS